MTIKLKTTLSILFILLFINNVSAISTEANACNQLLQKGELDAALIQAKKAIEYNKTDKEVRICQGRAYGYKGDFDAALASFNSLDALSSDASDKTISSYLIGRTYAQLKKNDLAIASFQQTISNAKTAKYQAYERIGHNAIGDVYLTNNQLALALDEYLLGTKLAANDNERGESYEKVAFTHHKMNQHDLALEYQIKAYLMHDTAGTLDQYAHSSIELGRYYIITKSYTSAENVLNKIIKLAKEQGGAYYEAQGSYVLAKVKVARGDIPEAKRLVEHAKSIAVAANDEALTKEIEQETVDLF
ncbi:tetratricopeptide repeat protein [Methylotenera sp.]|uniref:tetratricopeptide repeat protein n=1 Tax=Methylotenera sp. TaxID=2051956 RepID=UPI0025EA8133|nr:tetratricopeptide repeat protein [Methylotenera sp.]